MREADVRAVDAQRARLVLDAHDGFVIAAHQPDVHPAAGRREFDGVVDEISHRLNEKITVPINGSGSSVASPTRIRLIIAMS